MISVSTGGPQIGQMQHAFTREFDGVDTELANRGIDNPLPFRDLWQWYGRWKSGDLPTYASRRAFVADLVAPLIKRIQNGRGPEFEPTGWNRVDRTIADARTRLAQSKVEEHFQTVGLLCRELLISTAQAVYVAERHPILDGVAVSATDAKRMLEAYIAVEFGGGSNETMRKFAKAALDRVATRSSANGDVSRCCYLC